MNEARNDIIRKILDLYDTIAALSAENHQLQVRVAALKNAEPEMVARITRLDELVLAHGRKALMKEALDYWHTVHYDRDEDTDEVSVEPFEKWRRRCVKKEKVPDWCSLDEFFGYFEAELCDVYEAEREKAVAEAHDER